MKKHHRRNARLFAFSLILLSALAIMARAAPTPNQDHSYTTYYYNNPCGYAYSYTIYRAVVDSATPDRASYSPGDTVTVTGTAEVRAETFSADNCSCYYNGYQPYDPTTATVYLYINGVTGDVDRTTPNSDGSFQLTYAIPQNEPEGPLTFTASAAYSGGKFTIAMSCLTSHMLPTLPSAPPFQVSVAIPIPKLTVNTMSCPTPVNSGDSVTLSATVTVPAIDGGNTPPPTYAWSSPAGGTFDTPSSPTPTWTSPGGVTAPTNYVIYLTVSAPGYTDSDSASCTITVNPAPAVNLIPAITACDPALTIVMLIITIIVTVLIVRVLTRWIIPRRPFRTRRIVAIIVAVLIWFFFGAVAILGPGGVCVPAITWLLAIILILIVIMVFRDWFVGPPLPPLPPQLWPRGRLPPNVTGNATLTQPNGNRTRLSNRTLNQITRGSTIQTGNHSFVRMQTPQGSNSHTTIGENSSLSWLDPKTHLPWLKLPAESLANIERLLLQPNFGKLLLNWIESDAQEALLVLPAALIGLGGAAATSRWLARVKGTMLLVEATEDGTAAAITVLEDPTKPSSVELWRSEETGKVIEIHSGERVVLKTGQPPTKTRVNLPPDLSKEIEDPFNVMHRWWTLPPATDESFTALETLSTGSNMSTRTKTGGSGSRPLPNAYCSNCGQPLPKPNSKFCTKCGAEQRNASSADKCANCGEPLRPGKKFCMKCGTPIGRS